MHIKKIAVLGAGVMGAQIAAHCVNAGFATLLYDLSSEGNHNLIVDKALAQLTKLKPSPYATTQKAALLGARNYQDDLPELLECSLIIEAIAERMDWKTDLYKKITPYLTKNSMVVTNTSGLSINALSAVLPEICHAQFCGMHFFNPPRYMHLVELIPAEKTAPEFLDFLETWLTRYLGKGVIRAKDTPTFIANRIGVFSLLSTLRHAEAFAIDLDTVDALTGTLIGRAKSATFRTMDVVGLDTLNHVVRTMHDGLSTDPWHSLFNVPKWLLNLIDKGHLGQKSGQGIYRKAGKVIEVYDIKTGEYRASKGTCSAEIKTIFGVQNAEERWQKLSTSEHPEARFLTACFRDLFHYCAYHLETIASTCADVDLALSWGFGWSRGPFQMWQDGGIDAVKQVILQDVTLAALPEWLSMITEFYSSDGTYAPGAQKFIVDRQLPIYKRQNIARAHNKTLFENDGVRLWHLQDDTAVLNFKTKANTINQEVLDGVHNAVYFAEKNCQGVIVYQHDANNFSAGANLQQISVFIKADKMDAVDNMVAQFQDVNQLVKYSSIPWVAAVRGRALGGGCELMLHCARTVAAFESYPGLVEVGAGLIPAGGGCKEMARLAAIKAGPGALMPIIKSYFEQIAMATVASSAPHALACGYLHEKDIWVMHRDAVLYAAASTINAMQAVNYVAPVPTTFPVVGREGRAQLQSILVNWLEGSFISQHDYWLANHLATVLCGGDVDEGTLVDEKWMLHLERNAFMALAGHSLTQARIDYILETGKPLRN